MMQVWRAARRALYLSALAGLVYNSWIVGYWLDPAVARHGLASELEAVHRPYNWLFVACDIMCSCLVVGLAGWLWRWRSNWLQRLILLSYASFGLFTVADALLPMHCDPSIQRCPDVLHQPLLIAHGVCSIIASVGLFVAVVLLWWARRRNALLQLLIAGYVLFGIFSLISIVTPGQDSWAQHYALLLDGVCIAAVPVQFLTQFVSRGR
ncbi:MAG: DUF998 domain-containing protein [Sphingomonas oligoaromativorans]